MFSSVQSIVSIINSDQNRSLRIRSTSRTRSVPNFVTIAPGEIPYPRPATRQTSASSKTPVKNSSRDYFVPPPPPPPPQSSSNSVGFKPLNVDSNNSYSSNVSTGSLYDYNINSSTHNEYYQSYTSQDPSSPNYYTADKHKKKSYNSMMPARETAAYAHHNSPQSHIARFLHYCRQHATAVTAVLCFFVFLLIFTGEEVIGSSPGGSYGLRASGKVDPHWGGAVHAGYFTPKSAVASPTQFHFAAVTDMDQLSRVPGSEKPIFQSFMMPGMLTYDSSANKYKVEFGQMRTLVSGHNEAGRGMELSELTLYQNRLLAFDDRTGSIFEVLSHEDKSFVVPRFVITEGEGDTDKGMKWEWATVKDDELWIGSMGKEYTRPDGSIANTNNLWVATVNGKGEITRRDWAKQYNFVRHLLGADAPGYVIHEAVLWSQKLKKWIFIPRRVSADKYDDVIDEKKGTNKVVLVDEKFTNGEVIDIKMTVDPLHGFSSAAFVPNTNERHVAALRSVEEDCVGGDESLCKQRSYLMVFDVLTGEVLMDEVKFENDIKFEGLEFADVSIAPY